MNNGPEAAAKFYDDLEKTINGTQDEILNRVD